MDGGERFQPLLGVLRAVELERPVFLGIRLAPLVEPGDAASDATTGKSAFSASLLVLLSRDLARASTLIDSQAPAGDRPRNRLARRPGGYRRHRSQRRR